MSAAPHIPVLFPETLDALAISLGDLIVDGTFGAGGHSGGIVARGGRVVAFDQDPRAIAEASGIVAASGGAILLLQGNFANMVPLLKAQGIEKVRGILLDIGTSSMQMDRASYGFGFRTEGPLDMRMSAEGESAADFLNNAPEDVIADVIFRYGEEPRSRRVARSIVAARPLVTTTDLQAAVHKAIGKRPGDKTDPATRTFQAIRIHVNRELDVLEQGLEAAEQMLEEGGRLAVITFHSLEDRIVKNFMRARSGQESGGSRYRPALTASRAPTFQKPARAVRASEAELAANPRARSATLRSAVRTSAPAWPALTRGEMS
jgi:16S rRNA (cytosine1402-N4)-methyltransferase